MPTRPAFVKACGGSSQRCGPPRRDDPNTAPDETDGKALSAKELEDFVARQQQDVENRHSKRKQAREAAAREGIEIRYYNIIYDLVDDIKAATLSS